MGIGLPWATRKMVWARLAAWGVGIVEVSQASDLVAGDRVMVLDGLGTWGLYLRVPSAGVLWIDAAIPAEQAAKLKINP